MFHHIKLRHYGHILAAQIVLWVLASLMEEHLIAYLLFVLSLLSIFGTVIAGIWPSRLPRLISLALAAIALVSGFLWAIPGMPETAVMKGFFVCALAYAGFVLIATISIAQSVFGTERVSFNAIIGSICIYLLIGMCFAFLYTAIDIASPDAFLMSAHMTPRIEDFRDYLYFSYTTLTTLGYGDMIPMRPLSRMLASMEAIVGPIYLAIMVARLVGLHASQSSSHKPSSESISHGGRS